MPLKNRTRLIYRISNVNLFIGPCTAGERSRRSRITVYLLAAVAVVLISGCAALLPPMEYEDAEFASAGIPGLPVTLQYLPRDAEALPMIESAVSYGLAKASRWGGLDRPIRVVVLPDHDALEAAVDKRGYGWIRAWATESGISLESPCSWTVVRDSGMSAGYPKGTGKQCFFS